MVSAKNIRMVDLRGQYEKIKDEVDAGIREVIESTDFINGRAVKLFQSELEQYLGVKHVVPCANGTDALQIAMMALGLRPGDEVITASFTYVATAEVIGLLGLTPVLAEVDPDTFCIDPASIEKLITPKTRAIVPVHLFGQCGDMETIVAIAKKHGLFVIEDTAQSIGADYLYKDGRRVKSGTIGDVGCTSFFPSKNLGCYGDGGALYTNNDDLAARLRMIALHGQSAQYVHDVLGVNSRLDSIQAAVLRVKLKRLDDYAGARRKAADYYDKAFAGNTGIKTPVRSSKSTHVFHQYTLQLNEVDRNKVRQWLAERGIPSMIYYPIPVHRQKAYASDRNQDKDFPNTNRLCASVLSLPMHTELSEEEQKYIAENVTDAVATFKAR